MEVNMEKRLWDAVLNQIIILKELSYNQETGLLQEQISGRNYHTSITNGVIHRTRDNLTWLPALLKRGEAGDRDIALNTIQRVLELQDQNPDSPTYGIWPYLFEEPLEQMQNPDWNWAAFLGSILITLLKEFSKELPSKLIEDIKVALICASESILLRNMGVDYTNISLMSSFVLVLTGELLSEKRFFQKGVNNLERQLDFVKQNCGFAEYNSPAYGVIDIEETGRLLRYSGSEEVLSLARSLHGWCWKVFAEHYHPTTGQIAPPHARCYEDIQSPTIRTLITIGTQGTCELEPKDRWEINLLWPFMTLECPKELWECFQPQSVSKIIQEEFYKGYDPIENNELRVLIEKGTPPLTSYTYLHQEYCFGSFRRHDMWNQRRPLMAYFPTESGVACFRVRCMHDGMDFASAVMSNVQHKGMATGGISFVTDHGDYHYILDPIQDGKIMAKEFLVEFVLTGALEDAVVEKKSNSIWCIRVGLCTIYIKILEVAFGDSYIQIEPISNANSKGVRVVLYRGVQNTIDFLALDKAYVLYEMEITTGDEPSIRSEITRHEKSQVKIELITPDGFRDKVNIPEKPGLYMPALSGLTKAFEKGGFYYYEEGVLKDVP